FTLRVQARQMSGEVAVAGSEGGIEKLLEAALALRFEFGKICLQAVVHGVGGCGVLRDGSGEVEFFRCAGCKRQVVLEQVAAFDRVRRRVDALGDSSLGVLRGPGEAALRGVPRLQVVAFAGKFVEPCRGFLGDSRAHIEAESGAGGLCAGVANFDLLQDGALVGWQEHGGAEADSVDGLLANDAVREPLVDHCSGGIVGDRGEAVIEDQLAGREQPGAPGNGGNSAAGVRRKGDGGDGGDGFHGLRVAPVVLGDGQVEELHEGVGHADAGEIVKRGDAWELAGHCGQGIRGQGQGGGSGGGLQEGATVHWRSSREIITGRGTFWLDLIIVMIVMWAIRSKWCGLTSVALSDSVALRCGDYAFSFSAERMRSMRRSGMSQTIATMTYPAHAIHGRMNPSEMETA